MKRLLSGLILTLATLCTPALSASSSISYTEPVVKGIKLRVVTVNLNDPDVRVGIVMGQNRLGSAESFRSMIRRSAPDAAITGTFFCTDSLLPTGDIVVQGRRIWYGPVGAGIAFDRSNGVQFVDTKYGRQTDWSEFQTVLCGGPRLVRNGRKWVAPRAEGFRDPSLFQPRTRTAVAWKSSGKLLLVATLKPVTLSKLAHALVALGATDAISMDGGSSTGLYYRGSTIARPGRSLTNILTVYSSPARFAARAPGYR